MDVPIKYNSVKKMIDLIFRLIGAVLSITSIYYIIFESILIGEYLILGQWVLGLVIGLILLLQPWSFKKNKTKIGKVRLPPPEELDN